MRNRVAYPLIAVAFVAGCTSNRPVVLPRDQGYVGVEDNGWQSIFRVGNDYDPFVGSCWAVAPGLFATAAHVPEGEKSLRINGCEADLIYFDKGNDIAVLRCPSVVVPPLAMNTQPVVGIRARARGYTNGGGRPVQTSGSVSCVAWTDGFVGYDGGIQPGMSGSPVLDDEGRVLGVVSSVYSWHELSTFSPPNPTMGRLVPASVVMQVLATLSPDAPAIPLPHPTPPPAAVSEEPLQ